MIASRVTKALPMHKVNIRPTMVIALLSLISTVPAIAHHSYAMFDVSKRATRNGVVKLWEMTNPHATLWIYIQDEKKEYQLFGFEAPGTQALVRAGWNKNTVKPGDKVTVTFAPLRDGRNGGNLFKIVLADGRSMDAGGGGGQPEPGKQIHE